MNTNKIRPQWNLFRRKDESDLCCAVPDDSPVPSFVQTKDWEFLLTAGHAATFPPGFNAEAAEMAARLSGFYVFYVTGRSKPKRAVATLDPSALLRIGEAAQERGTA